MVIIITQEEIAKKLGISRATVGRAISGSHSIKKETKEKIMALVSEYGYEKNYVGSSLATKNSKVVYAFIVKSKSEFYTNEIYRGLIAINDEYKIYNISLKIIITDISNPTEQLETLKDTLSSKEIDGLIITPLLKKEIYNLLKSYREKLEIVSLGTRLDNSIYHVGPDHKKQGRISGELMLNLLRENEKLLIIDNGEDKVSSKLYLEGFISKIKDSHLNIIGPLDGKGIENTVITLNKYLQEEDITGIYINRFAHDSLKEISPILLKNKKIVVNGMGTTIKKLIQDKIITASVVEEVFQEGYLAGKKLFDLLLKETTSSCKWDISMSHIIFLENLNF